jgi:aminomethyltransferase
MADTGELNQLPLKDLHDAAGARYRGLCRLVDADHLPAGRAEGAPAHPREKAGLFDISHMKLFLRDGSAGSGEALARACPLDPSPGSMTAQSKYTFFLNDQAGILDDLIVTRLGDQRFMVVANAGNAAADEKHLKAGRGPSFDCTVEPLERVFLALQGPACGRRTLKAAGLDLSSLTFMHGLEPRDGWFASRSGYTGEDGFEIAMPLSDAQAFAETLLADDRVAWIGLAARDSLRLEAGLCLHGQDIDATTTPVEAGLMWAIPKSVRADGTFGGADALRAAIAAGPARKRVGLKPEGRQPVRAGAELFDGEGNPAGEIRSGGFGPSCGFPVAMGYVPADLAKPRSKLFAEVRGNRVPVEIHPLPFSPHRYRKG